MPGIVSCQAPFRDGSYQFGAFDANIAKALRQIDLTQAACGNEEDKVKLLRFCETSNRERCELLEWTFYDTMKSRLSLWFSGHVLVSAAGNNEVTDIKEVAKLHGLSLNSATLVGPLGEAALHVAAATGSADAVNTLLELKADPNIEDQLRERPLHYAALAGHNEITSMLLDAKADPFCESKLGDFTSQIFWHLFSLHTWCR